VNVNVPRDRNEQNKITLFLSAIDKKIETQRKLIDLYKSLIKTLREKLFNHQSDNLLGNEINFINGYAFAPKTYDINGKYYVCTISNVSGDRYLDLTQANRVSEIPKDLNINQRLFSGDILMSLTGNVGRISIVKYNNGLLNQRVAKIEVKNKPLSNLIYHTLSSEKFLKYVEKQSQGSSQNNLYYKNIEKFAIPSFDSNNRLLNVLDKIDFLIINHSILLQRLIGVKVFLLQNMFI
jgi:type I restriction enzyme S subunit